MTARWNGHGMAQSIAARQMWFSQRNSATTHGPKEFQAFAKRLPGALPHIHVTIRDEFGAADKVAVRWTALMTHQGNDLGIPASANPVHIVEISMVRIVNDKSWRGGQLG
jgi:hypothetical protein